MKPVVFASLSLLLAIVLWQAPSSAQTHSPTPLAQGELKGLVLDSNEARVAGAKITVKNKQYLFEAQSNDEGAFQLKLPSGDYQLTIESDGFKAYTRKRVRIEADKMETISATLQLAPSTGAIKVR
ncbi:MAG TPA: carboxypeptidase-like regulatory domain-containing protein [Pyrinomonadaceae bacterium]|jgi:hypothetical protein